MFLFCVEMLLLVYFSGEPQSSGNPYSAVNGSSSYVDGLVCVDPPARVKQQMFVAHMF